MAWRAITENDLLQRMSGDELAALREAALGDGQGDPIADQIAAVTDFVRGYIAAHRANTLGEAGMLPERLILPACDVLVINVSSRAAGILVDINGTRKSARDAAIRLFEQVAAGDYAIEEPETEGDETVASPQPSMYERDRYFDRTTQDGI